MPHVKLSKESGTATAGAAISRGQCLIRNAADLSTVIPATGQGQRIVGIATCDAESGDPVSVALPGEYAKALVTPDLNPGVDSNFSLASGADGALLVAGVGDRIAAVWYPSPGSDAGANDLITVLVCDGAAILA